MKWKETELPKWDDPEEIVNGCIEAQLKILSGYKGNQKTNLRKFTEALTPRHAAISLSGEPTLYPPIGDLIGEFHNMDFTTFLVSNGTIPGALSQLTVEPTQLYVSVCAFDEKSFRETCRPQIPAAWEKLNETLDFLPSFSCRKAIRITLVKGLNMDHPEKYADLIEKASPDFVEPKAFMHVGFSRMRLSYQNMPNHLDVRNFAVKLADALGYNILDECTSSRVVLLGRSEKKRLIKAT